MAEQPPAAMAAPVLMAPEMNSTALLTPSCPGALFAAKSKKTLATISLLALSSQSKFLVGVNLLSYLSMCVYKYALDVISKKPFMVKRKKLQELGNPGAFTRDGHPFIFLTKVCKEHDLSAGGSKAELSNCLLRYYFSKPIRVPDYVSRHFPHGEWLKAKERDLALSSDIEFLWDNCLPPRTDPAVDDNNSSDNTSFGHWSTQQ
jgi:hypothetical protein